ncbi:uncharacterized protein LOC141911105 [Tubulanus polymorphus]|uniref:uncharacterized protein LOC141911105 n=1 Tax=Tubulanus polymorphus TaxID=672921 RepID=UPI003DA41262
MATIAANYTNNTLLKPGSTREPSVEAYISFLNCYAAIFVVILGVFGNSASTLILLAIKALRTSTTGMLLIVLAFSDNGALLIGLFPVWIKAISGFSLYEESAAICKLRTVFMYFTLQFSSSILALIAIERFVSVYQPSKAKRWFSLKHAGIMVGCLALALFALNSHAFVTVTIVNVPEDPKPWCYAPPHYVNFSDNIWVYIDFSVYSVTWLIISFCNVSIILRMRRINQRVEYNSHRVSASAASRRSRLTSMTVMLLVVNTSFLITTIPFAIYVLCYTNHLNIDTQNMIYESLYLLSYLNNAINFLLYVISGAKFRSAMFDLMPDRGCIGGTLGSENGVTNRGFALSHVNSVTSARSQ